MDEFEKLEKQTIFKVSSNEKAIELDGVINSGAYVEFEKLAKQFPEIKSLNIVNCDGSINDDVNLKLAVYVHEQGFSTHLLANGLIASGGTDLFLAGIKRTTGENTQIGVHSWAGDKETATDFPVGHKHHLPYINYYVQVGFSQQEAEDFYYFTINAAPADSIHWMSKEEIKRYKLLTD
jgi:hypothetical protein